MKPREEPSENVLDFPTLTESQLAYLYEGELPAGKKALTHFPITMGASMVCPQNTLPPGETFQCQHSRGFVFTPAGFELLTLHDDGPDTIRFARTEIIDMYDGSNRLRGRDIIPNLVAQLKSIREALKTNDIECASYIDVHEGNTYIVVYCLSKNGAWMSKHYINPTTGEYAIVMPVEQD